MHYSIPNPPEEINSTNIIARLVEGVTYRYYWATEALTEKDTGFRPCDGSFNMSELNLHVYDLAYITNKTLGGNPSYKKEQLTDFNLAREEILNLYKNTSSRLKTMNNDDLETCIVSPKSIKREFPFWYVINGHIADALTHIGQITSWRRISGNPQPKEANVFLGQ